MVRRVASIVAIAALAVAGLGAGQPAPAEASSGVTTRTSLTVVSGIPAQYGEVVTLSVHLEYDGPAMLFGSPVNFLSGDTQIGQGVLLCYQNSCLAGFVTSSLPAGEHRIVAEFPGKPADGTFDEVLPSRSGEAVVNVLPAPTRTAWVTKPEPTTAFQPMTAAAQVTSDLTGLAGTAQLTADGTAIATSTLAADGSVVFSNVPAPAADADMQIVFPETGNHGESATAVFALAIAPIETETRLTLVPSVVRPDEVGEGFISIANLDQSILSDPRGNVEITLNGVVGLTIPTSSETDPISEDGRVELSMHFGHGVVGEYQLAARFVPDPGFVTSASASQPLTVRPIGTGLVVAGGTYSGTPKQPAVVEVSAAVADDAGAHTIGSAAPLMSLGGDNLAGAAWGADARGAVSNSEPDLVPNGTAINGSVQAYAGGKPLGDPVSLVDGKGKVVLAGLEIGDHTVELRFTPEYTALATSDTSVTVNVTADREVKPAPTRREAATLAQTGGDDQSAAQLAAVGLLSLGSLTLAAAMTRRRKQA